jgi:ATP-dependent Clp protease ATP-binding subunit ClpX
MDDNRVCSFCGKDRFSVRKLIAGPTAFICDECVILSSELLSQEKKENFLSNELLTLSPQKIKNEFDKYVIGQDDAKKSLAVAVNNHYKRLMFNTNEDIRDAKTNLLLIGPSSSGKTLLIKVLKKIMSKYGVPIAFADATTLTEAGYVGEDVENILLRLLQEADFDVAKTQKGIIFIDEVDKIALKSGSSSMTRDISGEGVQQALLGILHGKTAIVSPSNGRKNSNQENVLIDTKDILFICAGAFSGLNKIIEERITETNIGFYEKSRNLQTVKYQDVEAEDLIKFGMIPEFIARVPLIATLDDLTEEQLIDVMQVPKNALIKEYEMLFSANNAQLIVTDTALKAIAQKAIKKKLNARGLKGIFERIVRNVFFSLEDYAPCEVIIDEESVELNEPIVRLLRNADNEEKKQERYKEKTASLSFSI